MDSQIRHERWLILVEKLRKNQKLFWISVVIVLMAGLTMVAWEQFHIAQVLNQMERATYDARMRLDLGQYEKLKPHKDIVVVELDNRSVISGRKDIGRWPWPRSFMAKVNGFILKQEPKFLANDIIFSHFETDAPAINKPLEDLFAKSPNFYVGGMLDYSRPENESFGYILTPEERQMILPFQTPLINQLEKVNPLRNEALFFNFNFNDFEMIHKGLIRQKKRMLLLNAWSDDDGVYRGNPLLYRYFEPIPKKSTHPPYTPTEVDGVFKDRTGKLVDAKGYYLFTRENAPFLQGIIHYFPQVDLTLLWDSIGYNPQKSPPILTAENTLRFANYEIPLTTDGLFLIYWYPPPKNKISPYEKISIIDIITAMRHEEKHQLTSRDRSVMDKLKGKYIFLGLTGTAMYDIKVTPISRNTPGVYMQATTFDNLIQNKGFLTRLPYRAQILITGLLCLITVLVLFKIRNALWASAITLIMVLTYICAAIVVFKQWLVWMDIVMPIVWVVVMFALAYLVKYITQNRLYLESHKLATTDGLTGLHNHRYFQDHMVRSMSEANRHHYKFTLLLIDIDFFKKFNDTYGHQAGDQVLIQVAQKLKTCVRTHDLVARYGGEEMAIVLHRTDENGGVAAANKIVRSIAESPYEIAKDVSKHVTISVGLATYPTHGTSAPELIEFADQGLYRAKENGRNQLGSVPGLTSLFDDIQPVGGPSKELPGDHHH